MGGARERGGRGPVEVIVVVVLLLVAAMVVMMALPRRREVARGAACRANLMRIGRGVALYDQATGHLPAVPTLGATVADPSPLERVLREFRQGDFEGFRDPSRPPKPGAGPTVGPIPGLVCPSDPDHGVAFGRFRAPTSYRANTGSTPGGGDGPFAPGRALSIAQVEAADGAAYTAAFAERRLGSGTSGVAAPENYAVVPGPVSGPCPDSSGDAWRGDAGADWSVPGWASTLYNHALPPGGTPSCVAEDGATARMGASSGHVEAVHVLMLDGSVRGFTTTTDPGVWRKFGAFDDSARASR